MLQNSKNESSDSKELQISIKKYPSIKSTHLIDYFLIVGYEEIYIEQKIIKLIQGNKETSSNNKYKLNEYPTILSSINSDYKDEIIDDEDIIKHIFPEQPTILYSTGDNLDIDINPKNIIFSKKENNIFNIGYSYNFYECRSLLNRTRIFIPKAFVIISQYPYFITFNHICNEVYDLFHSNNIQIPIELQLYNIINYIPVPYEKRLDMTLFPFYELYTINSYQSNEEFISLENQKISSLLPNYGYDKPQLNISEIFDIIPIEVIVEIHLKLLTGHIISIFSSDIQLLNIIIYLLKYFLFPLNDNANVTCYNQNKYLNESKIVFNKDELIYGFNVDYNNISKNKVNNGDNKDNIFETNYYLDINKKSLNIDTNNTLDENSKKFSDFLKKIFEDSLTDNDNENTNNNNNNLENNIKKLVNNLNNIKEKIIKYGNNTVFNTNKYKYNFFECNSEKDLEINNSIIKSFYQFNLYISTQYYKNFIINTNTNNDIEEEKVFYELFSKSIYSKILNDFKNDYLKNNINQPDNTIKVIFENILLNRKINYNNSKFMENLNNIGVIEHFFKGKENDKFEAVTFLEFYKYFYNNLQSYFYDVISNEYVECTMNDTNNIKCLYRYKQINLDKNILLKYNYLLEQMPLEDKNKCFPYLTTPLLNASDAKIKIKDICNNFEHYFINNKLINNVEVIRLCILNVMALSTTGHKIIYFIEALHELMKKINISIYKFIYIILSIAYRVFIKEKNQNLFIYEKYFNIFNFVVENNLITPNNDINNIYNNILNFIESIKDKKKEEIEGNDYKSIKDVDNKKLYSLEPKLKEKEMLSNISNVTFNGNIKNNKITFKAKILKDKIFNINDIFSPLKVYNQLNKMVDEFSQNLEFNKINKDEYKKLIIHLIYYCSLFPQEFDKTIIKYLIYCLKTEH